MAIVYINQEKLEIAVCCFLIYVLHSLLNPSFLFKKKTHLNKALELDPYLAVAQFQMGVICYQLEHFSEALSHFTNCANVRTI
jgi:hypothetical protein